MPTPRKIDWDGQVGRRLKLRDLHAFFTVVKSAACPRRRHSLESPSPPFRKRSPNLEQAFGVRLLDRSPHGVEPTMYGDALLRRSVRHSMN